MTWQEVLERLVSRSDGISKQNPRCADMWKRCAARVEVEAGEVRMLRRRIKIDFQAATVSGRCCTLRSRICERCGPLTVQHLIRALNTSKSAIPKKPSKTSRNIASLKISAVLNRL